MEAAMRHLLFALAISGATIAQSPAPSSRVTRTLGGDGGWDYIVPSFSDHQ
jgi:hypothetical protein